MASKFRQERLSAKKNVDRRRENLRDEKNVDGDLPKIVFSLKDFDKSQIPPGQSYADW